MLVFMPINPVLQHKHKHKKNDLVCFSCAYANAYVTTVFTCIAFVIKNVPNRVNKASLHPNLYRLLSAISDGSRHIIGLLIGRYIKKGEISRDFRRQIC